MAEASEVTDNLTKQLAEIANGIKAVDQKADAIAKKTTILEGKIESNSNNALLSAMKGEEEDDLDELSGSKEIAQHVKNEVKKELANEFRKDNDYQRSCQQWDAQAFKKFPQLNDTTSEFSKATEIELSKIFPIGTDSNGKKILPPDAIYSAASRVAADLAIQGKLKIPVYEELEGGGNFQRTIKGKDMTEVQKDIATMFKGYGINETRLKERFKARNSTRA